MSSKRWVFTLNNYTDNDEVAVQAIECLYLVYGREVSSTFTPHLQGFVTFKTMQRLSGVKKLLPTAHWETARGSSCQASDYCKKDGNFFEKGKTPYQGKRTDLDEVCEKIKNGDSIRSVAESHPSTFVKFHRGIKELALTLCNPYNHDDVRGLWLVGNPGTGKSRYARSQFPGAYLKPQSKWFDGYNGEDAIILDDLDKGGICLGHHLKIWADRYACTGETKGGTVHLQHKTLVITSNYSIDELWADDEQMMEAIHRRFKVIRFGDHDFNPFNKNSF